MNVLYLIFLFSFFKCLGDILTQPLKIRKDDHLIQIAFGLIAASYITLFLASYGWLNRNLVFVLMAVVISIRVKNLSHFLILTGKKAIKFIRSFSVYEKLLFTVLILQISINFFLTLTPPTGWDSLAYHLTVPKLILQEGRMIRYTDYGGAGHPLLVQMLFTLGLLIHDAGLVKLICWSISVLTVMAIYSLTIRIGLRPAALLGSLIFSSTQVVSMWAGKCYIDIAFAFFVTSATIALIEFVQRKEKSLILVWLFISIFPGIKYSGVILSFIMGICFLSQILIQEKNVRSVLKAVSIGLLIILAINSPWYFMAKEKQISADKAILYTTVLEKPSAIRDYLTRWVFTLGRLSLSYDRDGRIGPVFLAFLPLLILMRPLKKEIRVLLMIGLSYIAIFLFFAYLFPRYVVPIMPILGIIAAYAFMKLGEGDKVLSGFLKGCLIFTFIFNLGLTFYNHRLDLSYLTGKIGKDEFLTTKVRCYPAISFINQNIRQGVILLLGETRVYHLDRPFFLLENLGGRPVKEVDKILRQKNITHIMVNERVIYKVKKNIEMQKVLEYLNEHLEMVYQQEHFKIYKLEKRDA